MKMIQESDNDVVYIITVGRVQTSFCTTLRRVSELLRYHRNKSPTRGFLSNGPAEPDAVARKGRCGPLHPPSRAIGGPDLGAINASSVHAKP
jgi:hypothetical protein